MENNAQLKLVFGPGKLSGVSRNGPKGTKDNPIGTLYYNSDILFRSCEVCERIHVLRAVVSATARVSRVVIVGGFFDCREHRLIRSKARFKRRTLHVPNPNANCKNNSFCSFALGSAHVEFDV